MYGIPLCLLSLSIFNMASASFHRIPVTEIKRLQNLVTDYYNKGDILVKDDNDDDDGSNAAFSCHIWKGRTTQGYARVSISYTNTLGVFVKSRKYLHVLIYFLHNQSFRPMPTIDVSHLCGTRNCVRWDHLSAEPRKINEARKKCHSAKSCTHHTGYADCVINDS